MMNAGKNSIIHNSPLAEVGGWGSMRTSSPAFFSSARLLFVELRSASGRSRRSTLPKGRW